jgi:hypothetical protein
MDTTTQRTEHPVTTSMDIAPATPSDLAMGGMQVTGMFFLAVILREIRMLVKECKS